MKKLLIALFAVVVTVSALAVCFAGCDKTNVGGEDDKDINPLLDLSEDVTLRIAGGATTWIGMNDVISKFENKYPNCTVEYESIENYTANLAVRLDSDAKGTIDEDDKIDIFTTSTIQEGTYGQLNKESEKYYFKDYACNLISDYAKNYVDLSHANPGLVENFKYTAAQDTLYAVPYGAELRGMYVNKTLLAECGLEVPTNSEELLDCCAVLKSRGYIPFQSAPGTFGQQLLYPWVCNAVVNGGDYEAKHAAIERIDDGISETFRPQYSFLYNLVSNGYYDYKSVEEDLGYNFSSSEAKAREFLNVKKNAQGVYEKDGDIGKMAFVPDAQSFNAILSKAKDDYHSAIEYEFILSPVGTDGGYAYMSPSTGIAANKNSDHLDWALEFVDFFLSPEVNKAYADIEGIIPNTADANEVIQQSFSIPANHISEVGQMTFGYAFYATVTKLMTAGYDDMVGIAKMNAVKYMDNDYAAVDADYIAAHTDETYFYYDGTKYKEASATYRESNPGPYYRVFHSEFMYSLDDYVARMEAEFQKIKAARTAA